MGLKPGEENQSSDVRKAVEEAGLDMGTVWIAYFTMGGNAGTWEVEAYIGGALSLPALDRDILAQAINELIDDLPPRRKATFSDGGAGAQSGGLNAARRELLPPSSGSEVPGRTVASSEQESPDDGSRESAGRGGHGGRHDESGDGDTRQRHNGEGGKD